MYDTIPTLQHDHLQENRHDRKVSVILSFVFVEGLLKPIMLGTFTSEHMFKAVVN